MPNNKLVTIPRLIDLAYQTAVKKGFHKEEKSPLEYYALIHSEISEAVEEVRQGNPPVYNLKHKPSGELIELADAVIRIFDLCGARGWDLEAAILAKMEYNQNREFMHGKKI